MPVFSYTASEYTKYQAALRKWVDTLVEYDDRQAFNGLAWGSGEGLKVCALGALALSLMDRTPQNAEEIYVYLNAMPIEWADDAIGGSFVSELVARNACRQNDIAPRSTFGLPRGIPWLNDTHGLTLVQFAAAIKATMAQIAEMVEIIPDPVPETTPELVTA